MRRAGGEQVQRLLPRRLDLVGEAGVVEGLFGQVAGDEADEGLVDAHQRVTAWGP